MAKKRRQRGGKANQKRSGTLALTKQKKMDQGDTNASPKAVHKQQETFGTIAITIARESLRGVGGHPYLLGVAVLLSLGFIYDIFEQMMIESPYKWWFFSTAVCLIFCGVVLGTTWKLTRPASENQPLPEPIPVPVHPEEKPPPPEQEPVEAPKPPPTPQLSVPGFYAEPDNLILTFGSNHASIPKNSNGFVDILAMHGMPGVLVAKVKNGKLSVAVQLVDHYNVLRLEGNKVSGLWPAWDFNSNESAMEVVDQKGIPRLQVIKRSETQIEVNGILRKGDEWIGLSPAGMRPLQPGQTLSDIAPNPIFKHPAWKYPGLLAD